MAPSILKAVFKCSRENLAGRQVKHTLTVLSSGFPFSLVPHAVRPAVSAQTFAESIFPVANVSGSVVPSYFTVSLFLAVCKVSFVDRQIAVSLDATAVGTSFFPLAAVRGPVWSVHAALTVRSSIADLAFVLIAVSVDEMAAALNFVAVEQTGVNRCIRKHHSSFTFLLTGDPGAFVSRSVFQNNKAMVLGHFFGVVVPSGLYLSRWLALRPRHLGVLVQQMSSRWRFLIG